MTPCIVDNECKEKTVYTCNSKFLCFKFGCGGRYCKTHQAKNFMDGDKIKLQVCQNCEKKVERNILLSVIVTIAIVLVLPWLIYLIWFLARG